MNLNKKLSNSLPLALSWLLVLFLSTPILAKADGIEYTLVSKLSVGTFEEFLLALLNIFIIIATPIIILFIIYSGFLYVTAKGNAEQVQQANRSLTYSIIGGVLVIGAVAITTIIGDTVASFRAE